MSLQICPSSFRWVLKGFRGLLNRGSYQPCEGRPPAQAARFPVQSWLKPQCANAGSNPKFLLHVISWTYFAVFEACRFGSFIPTHKNAIERIILSCKYQDPFARNYTAEFKSVSRYETRSGRFGFQVQPQEALETVRSTVDSKTLEDGRRMIYAGFPSRVAIRVCIGIIGWALLEVFYMGSMNSCGDCRLEGLEPHNC